MIVTDGLSQSQSVVVQERLKGAIAVLKTQCENRGHGRGDTIGRSHEKLHDALTDAITDGENARAQSHAQRCIGEQLALERYASYPNSLRATLKKYEQLLTRVMKDPKSIPVGDVALVYHPGEVGFHSRGYEFGELNAPRLQLIANAASRRSDAVFALGRKFDQIQALPDEPLKRRFHGTEKAEVFYIAAKQAAVEGARDIEIDAMYEYARRNCTADGLGALANAACSGHPEAQFTLGLRRLWHARIHEDPAALRASAYWINQAADQDHIEAQALLAGLHRDGAGVPHDLEKMVTWLAKAAAQGHAYARESLKELAAPASGDGLDAGGILRRNASDSMLTAPEASTTTHVAQRPSISRYAN